MPPNHSLIPKLPPADKALRNVVTGGFFRGFAAAVLSGAMNSATAFGKFAQNQLDLFAEAAKNDANIANPYNNFLDGAQKPVKVIYPRQLGVYIGDFGIDTEKVKTIIVENSSLLIKQGSTEIVRQPLLTLPSGLGLESSVSDTLSGERAYTESFGIRPTSMYTLRDNIVFTKNEVLNGYLVIDADALTYLKAIGAAIPVNRKGVLGVALYGTAEFPVQTNAA